MGDRWRHLQNIESETGRDLVTKQAAQEAWMRVVNKFDNLAFAAIFDVSVQSRAQQTNSLSDSHEVLSHLDIADNFDVGAAASQLLELVALDTGLQHAIFERLLHNQMSPLALAHGIRWLLQRGFEASA